MKSAMTIGITGEVDTKLTIIVEIPSKILKYGFRFVRLLE